MRKTILITAIIGALAFSMRAAEPRCRLADPAVESAIRAKAAKLKGGEHCQFRRYDAIDDFDGDGKDDFVVTFNVEGAGGGGNNVEGFLLVFLSSRKDGRPLEAKAGERGDELPDSISSDGSTIVIDTVAWTAKDPMCCPTGRGEMRFAVKDGKLVESGKKR